jgi:plastocyanin
MNPRVGARGLAIAVLVLAAIVATPAFSAAQDTDTTTTTSAPGPVAEPPPSVTPPEQGAPPDAGKPSGKPVEEEETDQAVSSPAPPAAVTNSAGTGVARASASATVSMGDNFFSPASVSIAEGDTVTWANNGQAPHSATADNGSFDTGVFNSGQSRSHTFSRAGTFAYFCTVHANMRGTVRVLAASSSGRKGDGSSAGSSGAGSSEAAAVASPDAAGTSTSLAATGLEALGLATIGLALLIGGIALRRRAGLGYRPPLL